MVKVLVADPTALPHPPQFVGLQGQATPNIRYQYARSLMRLLTLLQILAPKPEPEGPQCMILCPIKERMFSERLKEASVPPTRNDKVPAFAPVTPKTNP